MGQIPNSFCVVTVNLVLNHQRLPLVSLEQTTSCFIIITISYNLFTVDSIVLRFERLLHNSKYDSNAIQSTPQHEFSLIEYKF